MDRRTVPLTSIIVPVRHRPDLTRVCLDTLKLYTRDYELIVVHEGIEPGFETLTAQVRHVAAKGYPAAINAGYRCISPTSTAVVLLNADVALTPGWLDSLLNAIHQDGVGMAVPTLPEYAGAQSIEVKTTEPYLDVDLVKGVCCVLRREVADGIAAANGGQLLNEVYGMGGGDDSELSAQVRAAGFRIVVARQSFIYHYGSASFRELFHHDVDFSKKYAANRFSLFRSRHNDGHPPRVRVTIPTRDGRVHHALAMRLVQWSHDPEIQLSIRVYPHLSPLDYARNRAVKDFLEDFDDYMLHVDADIVPPRNAIRELLLADKDVIAPLCFTTKLDDHGRLFPMPVALRYNAQGQYEPYVPATDLLGVHQTNVVTGGCHLVKRAVFEQLERPYYFTYHKNGLVEYSEDFVFSRQCETLGYQLFTHYGVRCQHVRESDVLAMNDGFAHAAETAR